MSSSSKKPLGRSRPTPRRLFSTDSATSTASSLYASDGASETERNNQLKAVHEEGGAHGDSGSQFWLDKPLSVSPLEEKSEADALPERRVPKPLKHLKTKHEDAEILPSPSKARWDHLRQHVLPATSRSPTPTSSTQTVQPAPLPPRYPTPKPTRLQRLGLRGVVEHAREVAVDESRKFADEIQKACWFARFAEITLKPNKQERELNFSTMASNLHLPTSLAGTASSSTATLVSLATSGNKKQDPRRPQSTASLGFANSQEPSLMPLLQVITQYSTSTSDQIRNTSVPYESLVLSTLLRPFLVETDAGIDVERFCALKAFQILIGSLPPTSDEMSIERCLWCCHAALIPSSNIRTRILTLLSDMILPTGKSLQTRSPRNFQAILQGLINIFPELSAQESQSDLQILKRIIADVQTGKLGELDLKSLESDLGVPFSNEDNVPTIRQVLFVETLAMCLESGVEANRRWILRNLVEEYWPIPESLPPFTQMMASIYNRKLKAFSRIALLFITTRSKDSPMAKLDVEVIVRLLHTRVTPEAQALTGAGISRTRDDIVKVILELISVDIIKDVTQWANDSLCSWYHDLDWKVSVESALRQVINSGEWPVILRLVNSLAQTLAEESRKPLFAFILPILFEQLVTEAPAYPCLPLTDLLNRLSHTYPQLFYKPLFSCAVSSKDAVVVNHLWTLTIISKFLPDFWVRDAEMISIALMSEGRTKTTEGVEVVWGKPRLGQSVLLIELINQIQNIKRSLDLATDHSHADIIKFLFLLESRLGILIEAKERTTLIPLSQRLLFCVLFLEIRLFTRSLKSSSWLSLVVSWLLQSPINSDSSMLPEDVYEEMEDSMRQVQALYVAAQEGSRSTQKRRSTMLFSPNLDSVFPSGPSSDVPTNPFTVFGKRVEFVSGLPSTLVPKALQLIVALSGILKPDDYRRMGSFLWEQCLDEGDLRVITPACYLVMQCAEKTPEIFVTRILNDLKSSDETVKLRAIQRLSTLSNWRFQILSQQMILDRSHRRPFKLARGPLPFVATDIGSSLFILEEDPDDIKDKLPLELRKRLSEIGWTQEDKSLDQKQEWIRTPMSILPSYQLDRLDSEPPVPVSPSLSPSLSPQSPLSPGDHEAGLLRRKTSTIGAGHGVKRRAIFVPSLAEALLLAITLVFDPSLLVAGAACDMLTDLMRNDPVLLTRPIFDIFAEAEDEDKIDSAILLLRALLHVRQPFPPAMAHHIFNHLTGYIKHISRQVEPSVEPLHSYAYSIPILSKLATQVSEMSFRELRRAKVDMFLIPSTPFWFSSPISSSPMNPANYPGGIPPHIVYTTMISLSQNMLLLSMLRRNPQDVQMIRKNMPRLVLPSKWFSGDLPPLELADFIPCKWNASNPPLHDGLEGLSVTISRGYLLLAAQIFRSMSRHLSDRSELAVLVDGLNRILLKHGNDIGIVAQSMIALMIASTRFRRLFTSGGGYTLFMPAVVKVYVESEAHTGIRLAIEYAVNRFYALHQESFIFQSLDIIAHIMSMPGIEGDWVARNMCNLFATLRRGISPVTPDPAGIHNSNKVQEREALLVSTAEEKPQTFFASLRRGGPGRSEVTFNLPEEYEGGRLHIDNFIRLFLTVIAHDPTILRAQQFLRFFRYLTPYLYDAQHSTRSILRDGVIALGLVLSRAATKTKTPEIGSSQSVNDVNFEVLDQDIAILENSLHKSKSPSDLVAMRLDYLSVIVAFSTAGGRIGSTAHQRVIELVKVMLKDSARETDKYIVTFIHEYARAALLRKEFPPSAKELTAFLEELASLIAVYSKSMDFAPFFDILRQLLANPMYSSDATFSQLIVHQFCNPGLESLEEATSGPSYLSSHSSLISLISDSISLRGVDIVSELEKHAPSFEFLSKVMLPLVVTLKTTAEVVAESRSVDAWSRDAHTRVWVRLLSYTITACSKKEASLGQPERSRSRDKRNSKSSSGKARMKTLVLAIQILKIIVIRAEDDLSLCLPGIWTRIGSFLRSLLAEGGTSFAFNFYDQSAPPSPVQSPIHSPRASFSSPNPMAPNMLSSPLDLYSSAAQSQRSPLSSPRIIDYTLWSLFELLSLHRNPLLMQMRLFMQEKVALLDQDLRNQQSNSRPKSRRVSSMFSKPRRRVSNFQCPSYSPENSPTATTFPLPAPDANIRQPGYSRSPSSGKQEATGPRIVHLGPVSHSALNFPQSLSPGGAFGVQPMTRSAVVKSLKLITGTYKRIRLVQTCMGYDLLLPLSQSGTIGNWASSVDDDDLSETKTWTKNQALQAIIKETEDLMEEFDDGYKDVEDDLVVVDADQSVTF